MKRKFSILLIGSLLGFSALLGGCCSESIWGKLNQPSVVFHLKASANNEQQVREACGKLGSMYGLAVYVPNVKSSRFGHICGATGNSWLYYQCLAPGGELDFSVNESFDRRQIRIAVSGSSEDLRLAQLVEDWRRELTDRQVDFREEKWDVRHHAHNQHTNTNN